MSDETGIVIVDPGAGDIFADDALDFDVINGTLRIRFGVVGYDKPTVPAERRIVHVGRLIMPLESAQRMAVVINNVLKAAGVDPANVTAPSDQTLN